MATEYFGQVNVQFETDKDLTGEEIKALRKKFKSLVDDWDSAMLDLLDDLGISGNHIQVVFEDQNYPLQQTA